MLSKDRNKIWHLKTIENNWRTDCTKVNWWFFSLIIIKAFYIYFNWRMFLVKSQSFVSASWPESTRHYSGPMHFSKSRQGALWMLSGKPRFVLSLLAVLTSSLTIQEFSDFFFFIALQNRNVLWVSEVNIHSFLCLVYYYVLCTETWWLIFLLTDTWAVAGWPLQLPCKNHWLGEGAWREGAGNKDTGWWQELPGPAVTGPPACLSGRSAPGLALRRPGLPQNPVMTLHVCVMSQLCACMLSPDFYLSCHRFFFIFRPVSAVLGLSFE